MLGYRAKGTLDTHLQFSQIIEEEHESESNLQSEQHTARSSMANIGNRSLNPSTSRSKYGTKTNPTLKTSENAKKLSALTSNQSLLKTQNLVVEEA